MKILMTGFTVLQTNTRVRPSIQKLDVPRGFVQLLTKAGHEVDHRPVYVGDDLSRYDAQIVAVAPAVSMNSKHVPGGLYALAQDLPTVVFFDDWQINQVTTQFRTLTRTGAKQFQKVISGKPLYYGDLEAIGHHANLLLKTAEEFNKPWTRWVAGYPAYGWGRREVVGAAFPMIPTPDLFALDPSSMIDVHGAARPWEIKRREWTMAALMPHKYWVDHLNLSWPVAYFGSRKLTSQGVATRLASEQDVFNETNTRMGCLSPKYPQSGSGWFRTRYAYSALARSILWGDPMDAELLGPSFSHTTDQIEGMADRDLGRLADAQAEAVLSQFTTAAQLTKTLEEVVDAARWRVA